MRRPESRWNWKTSNRWIRIGGFSLVALAVAYAIFRTWGWPGQQGEQPLTSVATVGDLVITVSDRGELESSNAVQVVCDIEGGGKIVTIVAEGTPVKKDDEVARFDTDALLKAINEQEVQWELAEGKVKAAISELEVQKNKAESEIARADLALTLAKIDFESYEEGEYQVELDKRKGTLEIGRKEQKEADDNLEFTRGLVKKGLAQLEQIRVMELNAEGKRYAVSQQEADLRVLQKFTKVRKMIELKAKAEDALRELDRTKKSQAAATEKAENEVTATQKTAILEKQQLARLKLQLEKCVVKAPEAGIVIYSKQRYWDESSRIRAGAMLHYQQQIFTLPDLDKMQVKMKVHESVVKKVQKGHTATMQVDALSAKQLLHGKVISVATLAQNDDWRGGGVKEYDTLVSIDDLPKNAGLRPGMTAEVKILIKTVENALTVPVQAVTESDGKHICYVQNGSRIDRRTVEVGENNDQFVQILKGISSGDRVALDARVRAAGELKSGKNKDDSKQTPEDKKSAPEAPSLAQR